MNLEELTQLLTSPESVNEEHLEDLRALLKYAPYCSAAHMLLAKAMQKADDILFEPTVSKAILYTPNKRHLYFLLYPRKVSKRTVRLGSSDYFGMMETIERISRKSNESLQSLAVRLKEARLKLTVTPPTTHQDTTLLLITEEEVKRYLRLKKYEEALLILKQLNLNNPKKSSYFADQIRFIEKIVEARKNSATQP